MNGNWLLNDFGYFPFKLLSCTLWSAVEAEGMGELGGKENGLRKMSEYEIQLGGKLIYERTSMNTSDRLKCGALRHHAFRSLDNKRCNC